MTDDASRDEHWRSAERGTPDDAALVQRIPDVVFRYDRDGRILFANEAIRGVAGLPPSHYVGRFASEVSPHPGTAQEFEKARAAVTATGEPVVIEVRSDRPEGTRWFEYRVVPEQSREGRVETVLAVGRDVTDGHLALEAAQASEARYRALIEATTQVLWSASATGEPGADLNAFRRYTGQVIDPTRPLEPGEWLQWLHPDDRTSAAAAWTQALATGTFYETQYRLRRHDGVWRLVVARGAPVLDADGRVLEWIGTITDVTETERTRAELVAERQHLEEAQLLARLGSWTWEHESGRLIVSGPWASLIERGEERTEQPAAALRRALLPSERARFDEHMRHIQRERLNQSEGLWRVALRSGESLVLHMRSKWRFDADGRLLQGTGTFQDVTEQVTAQEALARERELLEESQRLAHVGSWELDLATNAVTSSAEMLRIAGLPPDAAALTPDQIADMMGDERDYVMTRLAEGISKVQPIEYEHHIRRADGTVRLVLARGRMVVNADGITVRVIGASQDITERRELELQLRQTQKMEALGLLAGSVAHDFNNLLSAILGSADLAREEVPDGSVAASDLDDVRHAAQRAAELTRQLLTFSSKQLHRLRVLDLREVVRRAEPLLRRLIPESVSLDLAGGPLACVVRADAGQVEQVLINLVVNARDAIAAARPSADTEEGTAGTVIVEVTTRTLPIGLPAPSAGGPLPPGVYAALLVRDTGTGMSAETKRRIFEPFFTTKEVGKGTGLGLSTVFGIVVQSGGAIEVESSLGVGTTFSVLLPSVNDPIDVADADTVTVPRGGSETVLLVEDERVVRETATRILERNGYRVIATRHGADALLAWNASVDVVVTDLRMPSMGGRELVDALRAERPDVPVVIMSGYIGEQDEAEVALLQRELFLEKPFTAESLLVHVRTALDR